MNIFLKAKHWQLFLVMLGIPLLFQFYMMVTMVTTFETTPPSNPENVLQIFESFQIFPIIMILFTLVFFGWFWSMAIGLQKHVPKDVKMNLKRFKIFFFIPLIYTTFFMIYMGSLFSEIGTNSFLDHMWVLAIIFPLHLFSMFCLFHSLYFVAKTIKTVELQRTVTFSEFLAEFFLLWFYFIGIWIIQPRVNALSLQKKSSINNT